MSKRLIGLVALLLTATALIVSCSTANPAVPQSGGSSNTGGSSGNSGSGGVSASGGSGGGNQCPAGSAPCNGTCVNSAIDANNCGACGNVCGGTQTCANGVCICPPGTLGCGTVCVNSAMDVNNCGQCGVMCSAGQTCTGTCTCAGGLTACASGCTNTMADGANCGACGMACAAGALCSAGSCITGGCPSPTVQCGTGCVDPATYQTDVLNCGACGNACPAGTECNAGSCGCAAGQTDCSGTCINVMGTDVNNCGGCGMACTAGQSCAAGVCGCAAGQTDCSGTCRDVMGSDNANCGGCGMACQAGQTCAMGVCSGGMRPGNCPATADIISDFEEGTGVMVDQAGRSGFWYVYADPTSGSQTPAAQMGAPIDAAPLPPGEECNAFAMHSTSQNHPQYVGFGATFIPGSTAADKSPYNVATAGGGNYTGISFRIRSEGTAPPMWFEFLNRETQPAEGGGTATNNAVDMYNTRGRLISNITTSWQTITIPFSTMAPRYLPSGCAAGVFCEAPLFNAASALGFQFSLYDQFNTSGAYNLWVDDVKLTTGDAGLPTLTQTGNFPFPRNAAPTNGCIKPTGADGKQLIEAFNTWKSTFVTNDQGNLRVRFDTPSETVSEGIAYGMLIAVYMGDRALFDGLWAYWKAHPSGNSYLMTWKIPGGSGSATDADEDAAFALIQASRQWGGTYAAEATTILDQIRATEIDTANGNALRPGNNFGPEGGAGITNPSYFAPAFYRVFANFDTGNGATWNALAASTHQYLNNIEETSPNGLVPAWCTNACDNRGGGSYENATMYQYDSHRTPWRQALDACWSGNSDARSYVNAVTQFFVSRVDTEGFGALMDMYDAAGMPIANAKMNSMSIIGTAAAGAAASTHANRQVFVDRAWQFLLSAMYTADPTFRTGPTAAYTYYNATVGLLMALTLSGNFNNFPSP